MALDNVPRRAADDPEIEGLIKNVTALQDQAVKALRNAQQLETASEDTYNSYTNHSNDMIAVNASKDDALMQLQGYLHY